jgi:3-methyladenine DNA glycosylase AlkD
MGHSFRYSRDVQTRAEISLPLLRSRLRRLASARDVRILSWFFKTAPGEYGAGDRFIGVRVPVLRRLAGEFQKLSSTATVKLLQSRIHEERLLALLILGNAYSVAGKSQQAAIYRLYLKNLAYVNNWDLVDSSAPQIMGRHLEKRSRMILFQLARSKILWRRRVAVLATFHFIRLDDFADALRLAELLLDDKHDLIHKAVGWMLRETGKRNRSALEKILRQHSARMPRTMLRYAIERLPERTRQFYLRSGKS